MEIITKPLKDLDIAHYNPRKDLGPDDPEYQKLKKSITEFGVVDPIVWNRCTGRVVGGHQAPAKPPEVSFGPEYLTGALSRW